MRPVLVVLVVLVGGCADFPPPPTCDQSANPDICELEQRLDAIENSARYREMARRSCEFAHGAGSILCQ